MSDFPKFRFDVSKLGEIEPFSGSKSRSYQHLGESSLSGHDIRMPLPPMQPGRVNFEALYEMGGIVIEAVPEEERARYKYWRGADLGKIAMNFARGIKTLNAGQDPVLHFADAYYYAANVAKDTKRVTQFSNEDRAELAALTGEDPTRALPKIVFALDEKYNGIYMPPSIHGMCDGVVLEGYLTTPMIDEYSRAVIEGIELK
ncbi:hypothetical protein KC960_01460 [Candidatus Saccharibacteria bacterium]|nr:hypothetical protein [Candidatus Saccharibacteria bacterium]